MAEIIVGVVSEVFNAVNGEGYTRDYNDGQPWLALRYTVLVDTPAGPQPMPVNVSSLDRHLPPTKVRALTVSETEIIGFVFHDKIRWHFQELPAVGCEP